MANIKDIAKTAGVSVTTVSRVLNGHPYVSEIKKEAVLVAMKQLNYQRNINAVHLSKGKTFLVGVVVPFSNHPYFGLLIEGIADEALREHFNLVLIQTNYVEERERDALEMLKHKQIDALIICSRISDWAVLDSYQEYGPIVLCEDTREKEYSSTFVDHYETFSSALNYLFEKGHKKIGYCIGRQTGTNSQQRETAYLDFLQKHGLPFDDNFIFSDSYYFEDGERIVEQLLLTKERPTALLVSSDQVAAGILTSAKEKGISVPDELAIMGFDNQPIAKMMEITTIHVPLVEVGRNLFHQAVDTEDTSYKKVPVKLIERKTV